VRTSECLRSAAHFLAWYGFKDGLFPHGMCDAINAVTLDDCKTYVRCCEVVEGLYKEDANGLHGGHALYWYGPLNVETHNARIIALYLAADIAEEYGE
jgi:hypothetical protein